MSTMNQVLVSAFLLLFGSSLMGAVPLPLTAKDKVEVLLLSAKANALTRNLLQLQLSVNAAIKQGQEHEVERSKLLQILRTLQADFSKKYKAKGYQLDATLQWVRHPTMAKTESTPF
jgi:acyl-CoA synthetase (AMP-forming)/AMP-acid ligase II